METPSPASSSPSTPSTLSASEQARLRKARREAKLRSGGADRLSRIVSMGGRTSASTKDPSPAPPVPSSTPSVPADSNSDLPQIPDAQKTKARPVDPPSSSGQKRIPTSDHYYEPTSSSTRETRIPQQPQVDEAQLRQMMLELTQGGGGIPRPAAAGGAGAGAESGGAPFAIPPSAEDDPMMKMLSQMLGGLPASGDGPMGAGMGMGMGMGMGFGNNAQGQQQNAQGERHTRIWKTLHTLFAILLGIYAVWGTGFTGSKVDRLRSDADAKDIPIFWLFATGELILQSSRLWVEGNRLAGSGILATLAGFLPRPYGDYVNVAGRYLIIASNVVSDAMILIFVLGIVAWWRGGGS